MHLTRGLDGPHQVRQLVTRLPVEASVLPRLAFRREEVPEELDAPPRVRKVHDFRGDL